MIPEYIPAVSALAGSMIGGITSLTAAWLTQCHQATAQRLTQEKTRRQKLYREFIEETSGLYADALAHNQAEISDFVKVYALIGRMRVLSNHQTIEKADEVVEMIVDTYFATNKTLTELRGMLNSPAIDPCETLAKRVEKNCKVSVLPHGDGLSQFVRLDLFQTQFRNRSAFLLARRSGAAVLAVTDRWPHKHSKCSTEVPAIPADSF